MPKHVGDAEIATASGSPLTTHHSALCDVHSELVSFWRGRLSGRVDAASDAATAQFPFVYPFIRLSFLLSAESPRFCSSTEENASSSASLCVSSSRLLFSLQIPSKLNTKVEAFLLFPFIYYV